MTRARRLLLPIFMMVYVCSCEPKGATNGDQRRATSNDPCKSDNPPASCSDIKDKPNDDDTDNQDLSNLADYLFSASAAANIKPFVENLRRIKAEDAETDEVSTYGPLKTFLTGFLKTLMDKKDLSPGRKFQVHILEDEELNAFADGDENVFINTGYIKNTDVLSMLATVCHEAAHSTRNHAAKRRDLFDKKEESFSKIYEELDAYYVKTYNTSSSTYKHSKTAYLALLKKWNDVIGDVSESFKHDESEADIVGAVLCAYAGMPAAKYIEGYKLDAELNAKINGTGAVLQASDLKEGESFEISEDDLEQFLFPIDTHPSDKERVDQLKRVKSVFEDYVTSDASLYQDFSQQYSVKRGLGLLDAPTNLAVLQAIHVKPHTTSEGRSVTIIKKPLCSIDPGSSRPGRTIKAAD